jgi:beta-lactamase superfamily II metal-dependent hydrolase
MTTVARDVTITFFPVGNGDTSLITLADNSNILIDLNVRQDSVDDDEPSCYDVHEHLLRELPRDADDRPHLDVFVVTHPDQDHVRGVETIFYFGPPGKYGKKHKDAGLIIVDELWFAPRIFGAHEDALCDDAEKVRAEAERRIEVFKVSKTKVLDAGDRVRIIGFTDNEDLKKLTKIMVAPGTVLDSFNHKDRDDFEFFVHAPFKRDSDDEDGCRNDTSIVLQARFTVGNDKRAALAFFGGDAGCCIWEDIVNRSDDEDLEWDLLLAPHHGSWTFFSETSSEDEEHSDTIMGFLDKRREGAVVVVSSKPIEDDDNNPPHYIAAERYREKVGEDNVYCTADEGTEDKPEPLHFSITANGPVKDRYGGSSEVRSSAARKSTITTPKTYGR